MPAELISIEWAGRINAAVAKRIILDHQPDTRIRTECSTADGVRVDHKTRRHQHAGVPRTETTGKHSGRVNAFDDSIALRLDQELSVCR